MKGGIIWGLTQGRYRPHPATQPSQSMGEDVGVTGFVLPPSHERKYGVVCGSNRPCPDPQL